MRRRGLAHPSPFPRHIPAHSRLCRRTRAARRSLSIRTDADKGSLRPAADAFIPTVTAPAQSLTVTAPLIYRRIPARPRLGRRAHAALPAHLHRAHPGICPSRPAAGVFIPTGDSAGAGDRRCAHQHRHMPRPRPAAGAHTRPSRPICTDRAHPGVCPRDPRQVSSSLVGRRGECTHTYTAIYRHTPRPGGRVADMCCFMAAVSVTAQSLLWRRRHLCRVAGAYTVVGMCCGRMAGDARVPAGSRMRRNMAVYGWRVGVA